MAGKTKSWKKLDPGDFQYDVIVPSRRGRGGSRRGDGQPPRPALKKSREIADQLAQSKNKTPLEVMLENMLWAHKQALKTMSEVESILEDAALAKDRPAVFEEHLEWRRISQQWACEAAPYIHPKLASIAKQQESFQHVEMIRRVIVDPANPHPKSFRSAA